MSTNLNAPDDPFNLPRFNVGWADFSVGEAEVPYSKGVPETRGSKELNNAKSNLIPIWSDRT